MSCFVPSAAQAANFKSQNRVQETPHKYSSHGSLQHNRRSQTALLHWGRAYSAFTGSQGERLLPEHCGSAISVTQLQHLPSSLHHVTRCEAFHGNMTCRLPFGAPSPKALLQSAVTPNTRELPAALHEQQQASPHSFCSF